MRRLVVDCPNCGPVYPLPVDVRLTVYTAIERSYCDIWCGSCLSVVRSPLAAQQVYELVAAGVPPRFCHLPAEALETKAGPPITEAEVDSFARDLAHRKYLAAPAGYGLGPVR
jgi:hypothetical protein